MNCVCGVKVQGICTGLSSVKLSSLWPQKKFKIISAISLFMPVLFFKLVSVQEDLQILFPDGHFESEQVIEEQQMILQQLPKMTKDCYYREATPPPALHIFTQLREDGENAMHFYSNPNFFFEHWRLSVQQKAEEEAKIIEINVSILTFTLWCNLWLVMEFWEDVCIVCGQD